MTTTWTGSPVLSAASINELRQAVHNAGGTPPMVGPTDRPLSCRSPLH